MTDQTIQHYNPHPGEHIVDELEELGMSQAELARSLGIPRNRVSEIIRGRRGISADTALRLARWLDTSPQMWLNLQAIYDLRKAEDEHGAEIHDRVTPLAPRQTG
jgi:addiction module HigA family antidote